VLIDDLRVGVVADVERGHDRLLIAVAAPAPAVLERDQVQHVADPPRVLNATGQREFTADLNVGRIRCTERDQPAALRVGPLGECLDPLQIAVIVDHYKGLAGYELYLEWTRAGLP